MDIKLKDDVQVTIMDKTDNRVIYKGKMDSKDIEITQKNKQEIKDLEN